MTTSRIPWRPLIVSAIGAASLLCIGWSAAHAASGPIWVNNSTSHTVTVQINSYVDQSGVKRSGPHRWRITPGERPLGLDGKLINASDVNFSIVTELGTKTWRQKNLDRQGRLTLYVAEKYLAGYSPPANSNGGGSRKLSDEEAKKIANNLSLLFLKDENEKELRKYEGYLRVQTPQYIRSKSEELAKKDAVKAGYRPGTSEYDRFVAMRTATWVRAYEAQVDKYRAKVAELRAFLKEREALKNAGKVVVRKPDNSRREFAGGTLGTGLVPETKESIRYFATHAEDGRLTSTLLPKYVDLSSDFPPPGNQGDQFSCVSWAVAYGVMSYYERLETGVRNRLTDNPSKPDPRYTFSPAFIHNQTVGRVKEGYFISKACEFVQKYGCATLAEMPYQEYTASTRPTSSARQRATRFRFLQWSCMWHDTFGPRRSATSKVLAAKRQLYDRRPVLIAAKLDKNFQFIGSRVWQQFDKNLPPSKHGRHAMVVVGYDDQKRAFKILNSWGQKYGDNGYWWVSYDLFPEVVYAAYTVQDAINYDLSGEWFGHDKPTNSVVKATLKHDRRRDRVTGKMTFWQESKLGGGSVDIVGNFDVDGGVKHSQLVLRPDFRRVSMIFEVTGATAASCAEMVRIGIGKRVTLKDGDKLTVIMRLDPPEQSFYRNDDFLGSKKYDEKTIRPQIDKIIDANQKMVVFRTLPATDSKFRFIFTFNGVTKDYTLAKK